MTYRYRVRADRIDTGQSSSWTPPVCGESRPLPNPPTIVSATAISDTALRLAWLDNSAVETGYRIYRSGGGQPGQLTELARDTTSHDVTGLIPGTNFCFRVMSFNLAGNWDFIWLFELQAAGELSRLTWRRPSSPACTPGPWPANPRR